VLKGGQRSPCSFVLAAEKRVMRFMNASTLGSSVVLASRMSSSSSGLDIEVSSASTFFTLAVIAKASFFSLP